MIFLIYYLISSGKLDFVILKNFVSVSGAVTLGIIFILLLTAYFSFSKRYQLFATALGYFAKFMDIFRISMVGLFYNNFLPGGTGGDIMRVYYLRKLVGVPIPVGTAATFLDRILGLLGLVFVSGITFAFALSLDNNSMEAFSEQRLLVIIAVLIVVGSVILLLLLRINFIFNFIKIIISKIIFGEHLVTILTTFRILSTNTKVLIFNMLLCIYGHIMTISCISVLAYLLYGADAVYASFTVAGIVLLLSAVPVTPGNLGWTEWVADSMYRAFGLEGGASIFMLWRVVALLFSLIGGIIYLRIGKVDVEKPDITPVNNA